MNMYPYYYRTPILKCKKCGVFYQGLWCSCEIKEEKLNLFELVRKKISKLIPRLIY